MKQIRRAIAAILVAVLTYGILGSSLFGVFAAATPVTITVDKYANGKLDFHWSQLPGTAAAVVAYHLPESGDKATTITTSGAILVGNSYSITGLASDYIYDISVTLYGSVNNGSPSGNPIGRGLLFYLPSITFYATPVSQDAEAVTGGGVQIGHKPKMELSWKVPKVYTDPDNVVYPDTETNTDNNGFTAANQKAAKSYMQSSLRKIYNDTRELATLNYRINISSLLKQLNSGSTQSSLLITQDLSNPANDDNYKVSISSVTGSAVKVTAPDTPGFVRFELWGRADEASVVVPPTTPNGTELLDDEIYPGTVYYMNIKPVYCDSSGNEVNAVTVGNKGDMNGSLLSGEHSYTSTPIRFQLSKDNANNVYVKIYKINQGSLDLPRLYYEVQASDSSSIQGDWTVKKTMDDSYFSGPTAVTIITGVNPNNKVYYKIVVKSDSASDRLESLPLPYILTIDTSRPPLPMGIALQDRTLVTQKVAPPTGAAITVNSTDVTISWDKPLNWNSIKNNLYFHFLLNTNQTEIKTDVPLYVDDTLWGNYPAKYRLVNYVSAESGRITEVGNRLSYTIKAFDLFKWDGSTSGSGGSIPNPGAYPDFLIPNTVYYLQMYTTDTANKGTSNATLMSDKSVIVSFTTLNGVERDVPLPTGFTIDKNSKTTKPPVLNYIDLKLDKIANLDWKNYVDIYDVNNYKYNTYYDIYMNTRTDTPFLLVGTTQDLNGDITYTGVDDPQSTSIKAHISQFTTTGAINLFGYNLLPNTTYYFKARTRLVQTTSQGDFVSEKESIDTAILPVTTVVLVITPPDDNLRKPLAPTDFDIAVDDSQTPLLTGNSVTFTWKREENDVIYQLIRTTQKVGPTDLLSSYANDPEYVSFLTEYGNYTENVSGSAIKKFVIDPTKASSSYSGKLKYDPATKMCTYTVDKRMFPNKLYYFSLKAIRVDSKRVPLSSAAESVWVSIPVTTSLIDAPASLEAVVIPELGFFWTDSTAGLTAEDFKIYAKISSESAYKQMSKSQATIVKDMDGHTYYGRITGLKANTYYDIKVTKGVNTPVYEKTGFKTKDSYHELEVKWKGMPSDNYLRYEIAIMAEGGKEYTLLSASDLEQYVNKDGAIAPYYSEETAQTAGSDQVYYHARIKSMKTELSGGLVTHQPLRSNVKYYIKVRAAKIDPTETDFIAYSKYIGPVNTRTEFNQGDYDNTDREEKKKAVFLDKLADLEKGYYWRIAISDGTASRILLKGDRVTDALKNTSGDSFIVDMTKLSVNINKDEIYVPVSVIRTMNSLGKNLVIRTTGSELMLRPATIDASSNEQIKEILGRQEVKDLYLRLIIVRSTTSSTALPLTLARISDINGLNAQACGLASTDSDLKQLFHDKLYDKDSGLVSEELNKLQNAYVGDGTGSSALIDQYTQSLVVEIEIELSSYIHSTLESVKLSNTVRDITTFDAPASVSLSASSSKGVRVPYVLYDDSTAWQKILSSSVQSGSTMRFNLIKTGKYVILAAQTNISDIPAGYWAESYITKLTSKYDLSDVFTGINGGFMPENKATCREAVLLFEKVTGKTTENASLDIKQKTEKLGLGGIFNANSLVRNVRRQETAAVLLKLFAVKKGVNANSLKPGGIINIADDNSIEDAFYNQVVMIVDMKVMSLDGSGKFYPNNQMTRAELVTAFVRLLEKVGE